MFCVLGSRLGRLTKAASLRRRHRCRPGTRKNWNACQSVYLQFCLFYHINWRAPALDDVGAFLELLVESDRSLATICNYVSAIKAFYFEWLAAEVGPLFQTPGWVAMIKGLNNTVMPKEDTRTAVVWEQLEAMVRVCNGDRALLPLKVGLIFGSWVI